MALLRFPFGIFSAREVFSFQRSLTRTACVSSPNLFSDVALFSMLTACIPFRLSIVYLGDAWTRSNMITSWCLGRHSIASRSLARCCTRLCFRLTALIVKRCLVTCGARARFSRISSLASNSIFSPSVMFL